MKNAILSAFLFLVVCLEAKSQLTLEAGESFSYFTNWSGVPAGFGPSRPGAVGASLDPATVQEGDVILLELFEGDVGQGLVYSQAFTNTTDFHSVGSNFVWWDYTAAFRFTMLSGSATINSIYGEVGIGGFFGPAQFYTINIVPSPRIRISRAGTAGPRVAWPTNATGYSLEFTPSLANTWVSVTNTVGITNDHFVVIPDGEVATGFFRLRKP